MSAGNALGAKEAAEQRRSPAGGGGADGDGRITSSSRRSGQECPLWSRLRGAEQDAAPLGSGGDGTAESTSQ